MNLFCPEASVVILSPGIRIFKAWPSKGFKEKNKEPNKPFYLAGLEFQNLSLQHQAAAETSVRLF